MIKPSVLIVGAGQVGTVLGYHLSLAGAKISFLVRPGRKATFASTQQLYSYDDNSLKTLTGYNVVEQPDEISDREYQYVIVTLDGHSSRTPEGTKLLQDIGDLIRHTGAIVIACGGFGIGVREHFLQSMAIPETRLLQGFQTLLSHQANAGLPVHPPADPEKIARANICYKHPSNRVGFRLGTSNSRAAKQFAELYNRSGASRCALMNPKLITIFSNSSFPVYAACEIAGWPSDVATVVNDGELWQLACRAQREIMALPHHGWLGKLMGFIMSPRMTAKLHLGMQRDMMPLDYQAFNHFHHGGKVRAQNLQALRECLAEGQRKGKTMSALKKLLKRLELQIEAD